MAKVALFALVLTADLHSIPPDLNLFVWDFATEPTSPVTPAVAASFTEDFEEALIRAGCMTILERRNHSQLLAQVQNEREISSLTQLSKGDEAHLRSKKASAVAFGRVLDDIESGHYRITVTLESFDSRILAKESEEMTRGMRLDSKSRSEAMSRLAEKFCNPKGATTEVPEKSRVQALPQIDPLFLNLQDGQSLRVPEVGAVVSVRFERVLERMDAVSVTVTPEGGEQARVVVIGAHQPVLPFQGRNGVFSLRVVDVDWDRKVVKANLQ